MSPERRSGSANQRQCGPDRSRPVPPSAHSRRAALPDFDGAGGGAGAAATGIAPAEMDGVLVDERHRDRGARLLLAGRHDIGEIVAAVIALGAGAGGGHDLRALDRELAAVEGAPVAIDDVGARRAGAADRAERDAEDKEELRSRHRLSFQLSALSSQLSAISRPAES